MITWSCLTLIATTLSGASEVGLLNNISEKIKIKSAIHII